MTDKCPIVLERTGAYCGKKVPNDGFGRCKDHTRKVPCPFMLPGDAACQVGLDEGWQNLDPREFSQHPHHDHYKVRMIVIDPHHRFCLAEGCKALSTHTEGYCDLHESHAQQARREMIAEVLVEAAEEQGKKVSDLTRKDCAEVLEVFEAIEVVATESRGSYDVTQYAAIDNPYAELYRLAGQTVAWKDALAEKIADMTEIGYEGRTGEQIKADVQLFTGALVECRQVLTAIAKLDVEERMVRIAEAQAILIAETLGRVLDSLGMTKEKQLQARSAVAERLRIVGASESQPVNRPISL